MKKGLALMGKILLYLFGTIITLVLMVLIIIRINSSQKPEPIVDSMGNTPPNSIAIIHDTIINGASQRLTIRGHNKSNPVLLRVHGGPGEPHAPQAYKFTGNDLEDLFTVCYWDQRGAGPAYNSELPDSTITRKQIVKDGLEVVKYLRDKFGKEKIYCEGISWGTAVSAFMIKEKPEYFKAYIGVGQMTDQIMNEVLSYEFAMDEAKRRNDTLAIKDLLSIGAPPYKTKEESARAVQVERKYIYKYVPPKLSMNTMDAMKLMLLYEGWSFSYKMKVLSEGMYGVAAPILWMENYEQNLFKEMPEWPIPVYLIQGENDHLTETALVEAYIDSLQAPKKELFILKDIGHFASAEDPLRYREIMKQILLNEEVK